MAEKLILNAQAIHKSFNGQEVLAGIDVQVEKGDVLAIIGPSGSGKSTLLRCLNHLEEIDGGRIQVDGETFVTQNNIGQVVYAPRPQAKKILGRMGMVFQHFNLFPHMTVLENLIEAPIHVKRKAVRSLFRGPKNCWHGSACQKSVMLIQLVCRVGSSSAWQLRVLCVWNRT